MQRAELKDTIVQQQLKVSKLEHQGFNSIPSLPNPTTAETAGIRKTDIPGHPLTVNESVRDTRTREHAETAPREEWEQSKERAELIEQAEREARCAKVAREKAEREARETTEQEAREKVEQRARERFERERAEEEEKKRADREAKERAEREAKERSERRAKATAERRALKEKAEREAKEKADREAKDREELKKSLASAL